jgi:hypothetical protein
MLKIISSLKHQARHVIFAYWCPANPEAMSFYFKINLVNQYRNKITFNFVKVDNVIGSTCGPPFYNCSVQQEDILQFYTSTWFCMNKKEFAQI